jgi:mannosyltransferase
LRVFDRHEISTPACALLGVVLLAGALRIPSVGSQSFWHDEALTVESARAPLSGIIDTVRNRENCPPAYFILINVWAKVFGISDVSLRLPSALMGIATVWAIYRLGRELGGGELGALTAAGLLAVSKFHIAFSQEARPYAMLMLLLTLCGWAWARVVKKGSARAQIGYLVSAALALYTHTFALFFIAVLIAAVLILSSQKDRQILDLRKWLILNAGVG